MLNNLNKEYLNLEWEVISCKNIDCWCGIIKIKNIDYIIIPQGSIEKELAEYFVTLHNKNIK